MPVLTIFAGPNGSGKSSLIRQVEFEGRENLLEADAIARRIKPELPQQAGISAGREVLRRAAEYVRSRESFAIETTLAGNWTNFAIRAALERQFFTRLLNIRGCAPDTPVERAIYVVYEAKRYSEKISSVGPETNIVVIAPVPAGSRPDQLMAMKVDEKGMAFLEGLRAKYGMREITAIPARRPLDLGLFPED